MDFNSQQLELIYSSVQRSLTDTIDRKNDLIAGFCGCEVSLDRFNAELPVYLDLIEKYDQILSQLELIHQVNNY